MALAESLLGVAAPSRAEAQPVFVGGAIWVLRGDVTFTVTSVAPTTGSYSAVPNHDPDGDSNGTKIRIRR